MKRPQARSFNLGPLPTSVYPGRHVIHLINYRLDQAFPLPFCVLQVIKTGQWKGLGTREGGKYSEKYWLVVELKAL